MRSSWVKGTIEEQPVAAREKSRVAAGRRAVRARMSQERGAAGDLTRAAPAERSGLDSKGLVGIEAGWRGGSVLAPWPSERVLSEISSTLARSITAVCVVEWGEQPFQSAWLEEHGAVSLLTGEPRSQGTQLLDPVVRFALLELSDAVNHNNALISAYEKSYAVRTLQQLVSAGYRFEVKTSAPLHSPLGSPWKKANACGSTRRRFLMAGPFAYGRRWGRPNRLLLAGQAKRSRPIKMVR